MRKFRSKFLKNFINFFLYSILVILYCEYFHYFIILSQCSWPSFQRKTTENNYEVLKVMVLADTHLLGSRNGHWFDKLRREWQMHRSFQTSIMLHNPDLVIFLGDLFDEGKWCPPEEFEYYVKRFHYLFYIPKSTELLIAAGNHDMGFHYSLNSYLASRFEEAFKAPSVQIRSIRGVLFVAINSMAMHGDDCFLCKPARLQIEEISRNLRCLGNSSLSKCKELSPTVDLNEFTRPILVQHYPLYRESDAVCSEIDSAPHEEKKRKFREKWECLSRDNSEMLLRELEPRLILSGHTHHGCQVYHNFTSKYSNMDFSVLEYTISSFSWRNKPNPTFAMMSATRDNAVIYKCHIPDENSVIVIYITLFTSYFLYILKKKVKVMNFLYFRVKEICRVN
ncbi:UNVERIFIED_CONTAM: hypothetical protein RMT77_003384 [Armadillidium vulgare]